MKRLVLVSLLLLLVSLSGCGGDEADEINQAKSPASPGPTNGGSETPTSGESASWPDGLTGPFELKEVLHVFVPMSDGVELEGWIGLPELPDGVKAPTLVSISPYYGYCPVSVLGGCGPPPSCAPTPDDPQWWEEDALLDATFAHWGIPPRELIKQGYAVSFFSVRGTGNSGGCFDWFGERTRLDHAEIVEWLAEQEWSSGRVGAGGLSLPSVAAGQAAVQAPEALKAIIIGGTMSDFYTFHATPQGAYRTTTPACLTPIAVETSFGGFARASDPAGGFAGYFAVAGERLCPHTAEIMTHDLRTVLMEDRDAAFYEERRLADDLKNIKAAVLLAQGYFDGWRFEDDTYYQALGDIPKRRLTGPWPHQFPTEDATTFPAGWAQPSWQETVIAWLDQWVKGIDAQARVNVVDYQDIDGTWRSSSSWPPAEASEEVLYMVDSRLSPVPAEGSASFLSMPNILNSAAGAYEVGFPYMPHAPLCNPFGLDTGTGLVFMTEATTGPVTIAGMPHLWLKLSSNLGHGMLQARVGVIGEDFSCDPVAQATGYRDLNLWSGGADLRFHAGHFEARPFPVDTPTQVRVDIPDFSVTLQPGERLVVEVSYGETHIDFINRPPYAQLTVHGGLDADASHLVLPIVQGSFGGATPTVNYPQRPFSPGWTAPE